MGAVPPDAVLASGSPGGGPVGWVFVPASGGDPAYYIAEDSPLNPFNKIQYTGSPHVQILVVPGNTFHYQGYAIQIVSVGNGGTGLLTDEGVNLPIGTVYTITSGPGIGETWRTTGPSSAVQQTGSANTVTPPHGPGFTSDGMPLLPPGTCAPGQTYVAPGGNMGPSYNNQITPTGACIDPAVAASSAFDFSSIPLWGWVAIAAGGYLLLSGRR